MKKFRFLTVLALAISMLFVVAAAADIDVSDVEYNGTDETITVTVKTATAKEIDGFSAFQMSYDSTVFSVASTTSSDAEATINTATAGIVKWSNSLNGTVTSVGDEILKVVFNVIAADKTTAYDKQFVVSAKSSMWDAVGELDYSGTITVKAAAQDETVHGSETAATKTELVVGDTFYKNIAIFDNAITLDAEKTAKKVGWTLKSTDATKADKVIEYTLPTAISGGGTVQFAGIVYNIPAAVTVTAVPFVVYGN